MTENREGGYKALLCDDCRVEIFVDDNMVMLNDKLCRKIEVEDFRLSSDGPDSAFKGIIPCNAAWLWNKHRNKYLEIWPEHKKFDIDAID